MAAQIRTGSPHYPTFATTTKPQMGCTRYIQRWTPRPYEFYTINISGIWYASLTSRWNKWDSCFVLSSLSLSLLTFLSVYFSLFLYFSSLPLSLISAISSCFFMITTWSISSVTPSLLCLDRNFLKGNFFRSSAITSESSISVNFFRALFSHFDISFVIVITLTHDKKLCS